MELLDLQLFAAVAREQSISRAAAGMHMSQPSVSQRMMALEAEVGRQLFTRQRRGVALTPAGQVLLGYAERVLGLLTEGVEAARRQEGGITRINLAAPPSISGYFLPPLMRLLVDAGYDVSVYDTHSTEVMQMLLDGTIHVGFVLGMPGHAAIQQRVVLRDQILCVAAPTHPLAGAEGLSLADLRGHRLALYSFSNEWETFRDALEAGMGAPVRGLVKTTPAESARTLVLGGDFVTFLPRITVQADLDAGRLVQLQVAGLPEFGWKIAMAYRARKVVDPAVEAILQAAETLWKN